MRCRRARWKPGWRSRWSGKRRRGNEMAIEQSELERLQRETNEALGRLVLELRENPRTLPSAGADAGGVAEQPLRDVSDALGRTTGAMQHLTEGLGANAG